VSGERPRVGLILPALDEEEALPLVLGDLPAGACDRVVVVDNGSSDGTARVGREAGAEVVSEPRRGYGSACLAGLDVLFGRAEAQEPTGPPLGSERGPLGPDDVVVFLDADRSDHADDIDVVLEPLRAGRAELVIGSRILGGATMEALLPQAWFGNRLACGLMRLLFGARYSDLGPFRAIRVRALEALEMGDRGFGWTIEMQLKAHSAGLAVEEVPVRYRPRVGTSKITGTLSGTLGAGWKILGWIGAWRVRTLLRR
jgi:glycosyltransferase involved in cell wall biosynthesis